MESLAFVQYVLDKNQVTEGFSLEALCAHAEFLREKSDSLKKKKELIAQYEPIFAHYQRPFEINTNNR
ncbi:MAG: hypothetical protein ACYCVD_12575 [Desulfitobacteriaceae bacterium]